MGQSASLESRASSEFTDELDFLHEQIRKHSLTLRQLTYLTYDDLHNKIAELNALSSKYVDCNGKQLMFEIKPGTDSHVLWKGTVKVICLKLDPATQKVEKTRELHLKQFLQVYNTMQLHLNASHTSKKASNVQGVGSKDDAEGGSTTATNNDSEELSTSKKNDPLTVDMNASILLDSVTSSENFVDNSYERDECCICLDHKPEVILGKCTHSFCLACIEQWNIEHKTCPVCRDEIQNTDNSWLLEEVPADEDVKNEIQKSLFSLTK